MSPGRSLCVRRRTSSITPGGSDGLRPRPFAITPTPAVPWTSNLVRHRRTASASTSQRRAISAFATPYRSQQQAFRLHHDPMRSRHRPRHRDQFTTLFSSNAKGCSRRLGHDTENTLLFHRRTTSSPVGLCIREHKPEDTTDKTDAGDDLCGPALDAGRWSSVPGAGFKVDHTPCLARVSGDVELEAPGHTTRAADQVARHDHEHVFLLHRAWAELEV